MVITAAFGGSEQFYVNANIVLVPFLHSGSINSHSIHVHLAYITGGVLDKLRVFPADES